MARWVLLCFMASIIAAVVSPIAQARATELVCSGTGAIKLMIRTEDGLREVGGSHFDCPACLPVGAPPPLPGAQPNAPPAPLAAALAPARAAHIAAVTAAPLPARGPPLSVSHSSR